MRAASMTISAHPSGRDFGRKQGGLYVFNPTITADNSVWYRGTADSMYQNLDFLKNSHEPYVVIASGDGVYKLDFAKVLVCPYREEGGHHGCCKGASGR